jgi:hypothetical protein
VENLPPVSITLAVPVAKFAAGVIDTGGATCLQISPQILEKIEVSLMLFSGAWGKMFM